MTAPFEKSCMPYEMCIRAAFKCERGKDPKGLADADYFAQGHWGEVAAGLAQALRQYKKRSLSPSQMALLDQAIACLEASEKENAHFIGALIHTMQALL